MKEWDMASLRASTYTVFVQFTPNQVQKWIDSLDSELVRPNNNLSYGMRLKEHLIKTIETHINMDIDRKTKVQQWSVADVNINYKNQEVIRILHKRGKAIAERDWNKRNEINRQLTEYVRKNRQRLLTPTAAFITLEQKAACDHLLIRNKLLVFKKYTQVREAPAPSDIKFQNLEVKWQERNPKMVLICLVVVMIFVMKATLSSYMRLTLSDVNAKYMATGNCDELIASFNKDDLAEQAADDFTFYDSRGGDD